ncbi:MAG: hypothetical protein RIC38_08355 [Chromatocurvus sp.]
MRPYITEEQDLTLGAESEITYSFRRIEVSESRTSTPVHILLLQFTGPYGVGSAGRRDAAFLLAMSKAALTLWPPDALIFDLQALEYVWGDNICELFDIPRLVGFDLPAAVAASRLNHTPLEGILNSFIGQPPISVFLHVDRAIDHVFHAASERRTCL